VAPEILFHGFSFGVVGASKEKTVFQEMSQAFRLGRFILDPKINRRSQAQQGPGVFLKKENSEPVFEAERLIWTRDLSGKWPDDKKGEDEA